MKCTKTVPELLLRVKILMLFRGGDSCDFNFEVVDVNIRVVVVPDVYFQAGGIFYIFWWNSELI